MHPLPGTDEFTLLLERVRTRHYLQIARSIVAAVGPRRQFAIEYGQALAWSQGGYARLMGLHPPDLGCLDEFDAVAREFKLTPCIDVAPTLENETVVEALQQAGYRMRRWQAQLWADPRKCQPGPTPAVEPLDKATPEFIDVFLRGYGVPEGEIEEEWPLTEARFASGDWRLWLGRVDGRPAAAGALAVVDGIGRLANACTLPEHRGRGLQTQLLHARIRQAADEGLTLVVSDARPGSVSLRNMARAGLRPGAQLTGWER